MLTIGTNSCGAVQSVQMGVIYLESLLTQTNMAQNTDAYGGRRKRLLQDINRKIDLFQGHCHMKMLQHPSAIDGNEKSPTYGMETNQDRINWADLHNRCGEFIDEMSEYKLKQRENKCWIS